MPHYADGTPVALDDFAEAETHEGLIRGVVLSIHECESCNVVLGRVVVDIETKVVNGKRVAIEFSTYPIARIATHTVTALKCRKLA